MHFLYLLATVLLLLCSACGDEAATSANGEPAPLTTTGPNTMPEGKPSSTSEVVEVPTETDPYAPERAKINQAVALINTNLSEYTKKEYDVEFKNDAYQLQQYFDKNGVMVKAEAVSNNKQWAFYAKALNQTDNKIIYAEVNNAPTPKKYFSIGSMIQGQENFALIIDDNNKTLPAPALAIAEEEYEEAMLTFTAYK